MVAADSFQRDITTPGWGAISANRYGMLWFVLLIVASIPVFWTGFVSLGDAWVTPEYSHGPIIPLLSAYLFLRDMRKVPPTAQPVRDRWPGALIIAAALGLAIFGNLVNISDIVTYAFIVWVGGMVLLSFGFSRGLVFWTGVLHLVYMLPLPTFIYWQMTIALQLVSSEIGVWFVKLAGIPVYLEGNVIDLGVYKLLVAEACSGLRYLFPILSFSYVFCVLYNGPVWHKIVILVAAAPITVFMNAFRIGVIGILVDRYGIAQAEGFLHAFEGWVIFGACIGLLFLLAVIMQRFQRNPQPLRDTLDIDFDGVGPQLARITAIPLTGALVAATLLTTAVSTAWLAMPAREAVEVDRDPFGLYPMELGAWTGVAAQLEPQIERVLNADDYLQAGYIAPGEAAPVALFAAWHRRQTGAGIHTPDICLPADGWEMYDIAPVTIDLQAETGWAPFQSNRAIIQKGLERQVVYYWFEQHGTRLTNDFAAKIHAMFATLRTGRADGALVRYTTPVLDGETVAEADARIRRFMALSLPELPRYLPE